MSTPYTLVTGASTGIGFELVKLLAEDKKNLILLARGKERLEKIASDLKKQFSISVQIFPVDLSLPESPQKIYRFVNENGWKIDTLINNAGYGSSGAFDKSPLTEELGMIQVNITALVELTHLFMEDLILSGNGKILNVASTASFQPGPYMSIYYATKAFVLHFSEGISEELKDRGVTVSTLCPGPTLTEFQKRANTSESNLFKGPLVMDAATVARIGYRGMKKGKVIVIAGFWNALLTGSVRITPRFIIRKITGFLNRG